VSQLAPHDDALRARVAAEPDITLAELQAWLLAERKVNVSIGCLWNRLKFLKLPLKKSERAAEQDRSDVAQARDEWRASQSELNPERLVFIDETGARNARDTNRKSYNGPGLCLTRVNGRIQVHRTRPD
jgi:hypothetical protein